MPEAFLQKLCHVRDDEEDGEEGAVRIAVHDRRHEREEVDQDGGDPERFEAEVELVL